MIRKRFGHGKNGRLSTILRWVFLFIGLLLMTYLFLTISIYNPKHILFHRNVDGQILNFITYTNYNYCVLYNFWTATIVDVEQITLIVHASPKFIDYIPVQILNWNGPISVAVEILWPVYESTEDGFQIPSPMFLALLEEFYAMEEFYDTRNVSLHMFFKKFNDFPCPEIHLNRLKRINSNHVEQITLKNAEKQIYSINTARNIARLGSKTKLFLLNDIENIMVRNYEQRMRKLATEMLLRKRMKTVLVHRRFEIAMNVTSLPRTKKELEMLYVKKQAVQFHTFTYPSGHYIPRIKDWFQKPENFVTATVANEYQYLNGDWEPQFVADASIPLHDERFPLRMRSNTHLGNLLCRQGYTFTIVNDLFSVHRGIKRWESKDDIFWQKMALRSGYRKTVKHFRVMLDELYPETKDQCPLFKF